MVMGASSAEQSSCQSTEKSQQDASEDNGASAVTVPPFPPPPDGGGLAWTQVFMGHLVLINGWGYLSSFGLFQSYYTSTFSETPSAISWIGSIQIFLVYLIGTFSGRALDAGKYHFTIRLGCFLQVLGIFMSSISTQYWQLFLAQGVCKGIGDGLVFCPTVSLVATYFSKKRSLAMACTASGGATGGIIFPLIARQLLGPLGFGWTVRIMGFVVLFNSILITLLARVRLPPRKTGPIFEWAAFKEPSYSLFCVGMFFNLWAVYFAYFYVSTNRGTVLLTASTANIQSDQLVRQVHHPHRIGHITHASFDYECHWYPRPTCLWSHCGSSTRPSQHAHSCRVLCRHPILQLGSHYNRNRLVCILRHLRLLWRWYPEPIPRGMRELN
jgi:hypothetical protein